MATGIRVRHSRNCTSREGGRCSCKPTYQAQAYDTRTGRQVWRTFHTLSAAKLWRQDAQVALRRGTMRPPTAKTIAEAAEVLIKGAHEGTILDRAGSRTSRRPPAGMSNSSTPTSSPPSADGSCPSCSAATFRTSSTACAARASPPRRSRTSSIRFASSSGGRSAATRSPSTRPRISTCLPSAAAGTGSSRPRWLLAALPDTEKAFWAVALFCGLRRGELRGLQWTNVDFDNGVIRVERSWDPVKGPVDVKTGAGRRAVPMAFVVRRELMTHKQRSNRDGPDLVFGRTTTEAFFASTIRARANKAWEAASLEPITPHEARHCAISYFIAAGLDWKQISTWAGHGDVRQTWNRYGHSSQAAKIKPERDWMPT